MIAAPIRRPLALFLSAALALSLSTGASRGQFGPPFRPKNIRNIGGGAPAVRMVWRCGNCKRELADGLRADSCPFCGVRFRGGFPGNDPVAGPADVAGTAAVGGLCLAVTIGIAVLAFAVVGIVLFATLGGKKRRTGRGRRPDRDDDPPRRRGARRSDADEPIFEPELADEPIYEPTEAVDFPRRGRRP